MILNNTKILTRIFIGFLFIALMVIGVNAQELKGQWKLVEMTVDGARFDLTSDKTPTMIFGEESRVSGNGGCNRYSTTYDLTNKVIHFKPFISTKMACADDKRNSQEVKYFVAFGKVNKFKISKKSLSFTDKRKKTVLKFVPLDSE
jgi:heat shock protein HslJ